MPVVESPISLPALSLNRCSLLVLPWLHAYPVFHNKTRIVAATGESLPEFACSNGREEKPGGATGKPPTSHAGAPWTAVRPSAAFWNRVVLVLIGHLRKRNLHRVLCEIPSRLCVRRQKSNKQARRLSGIESLAGRSVGESERQRLRANTVISGVVRAALCSTA